MRWLPILLLAAALGVSSAFLVACGDRNGLLPSSAANAINSDLDEASSLVAAQECRRAQAAVVDAQATAAELPRTVDGDLRTTLADNLQHVLSRVRADCGKTTSTQKTTPTTPTRTQPTATQPTTTETVPTTTTTAPTQPPATTTTESGAPSGPGNSGGTPAGGGRRGSSGGASQ